MQALINFINGLDPKVSKPFLAGLLAVGTHSFVTGSFDKAEIAALVLNFGYGLIGYQARNGGSDERDSAEHRALEEDLTA